MPLRTLNLGSAQAVHQLIDKWKKLKIITTDVKHITSPAAVLAKHLFVATDGNTYLSEDIVALSKRSVAR